MNLHVCERNNIFHNLYLVVNSELSVVSALAHTGTEICTTSVVTFVILICMLKVLKFSHFQLARVRKKQNFSQSLPRGELWTVRRLALAHTRYAPLHLSILSYWLSMLYAEGAKIHATVSTCTCAKETTFFTISTSWWTLNCPSV